MADTADEVIEYSAESLLRCIWQLLADFVAEVI
jgi:hypothetical protein